MKWQMTPAPVPILTYTTVPIDTTQPSHGSINTTPFGVQTNKKIELTVHLEKGGIQLFGMG